MNGIINVDFADVRTVMSAMGRALMGSGCAKGEGRARLAAEQAICSPLLDDVSVEGATGVLINIVGGPDMKIKEIREAASLVQEQAHEDANVIFGASVDEAMGDALKVTVIATGFQPAPSSILLDSSRELRRPAPAATAVRDRLPADSRAPRSEFREAAPALSTRRPQPAPAAAHGASPRDSQMSLMVRDIPFPSSLETDWDTPAYKRRQGGLP
jgi:cell division protein FtsZ